MDFKSSIRFLSYFAIVIIVFVSCSDRVKSNTNNTFYVELVNFNHDSLKRNVAERDFWESFVLSK